MPSLSVKPLDNTTWPAFAQLVERHNGVWGGCLCMAFHPEGVGRGKTAAQNRSERECRVREGPAHAALVFGSRTVSGSFLHNATLAMFEREGFEATRRLGKNHWVVAKRVRRLLNRGAARAGQDAA